MDVPISKLGIFFILSLLSEVATVNKSCLLKKKTSCSKGHVITDHTMTSYNTVTVVTRLLPVDI